MTSDTELDFDDEDTQKEIVYRIGRARMNDDGIVTLEELYEGAIPVIKRLYPENTNPREAVRGRTYELMDPTEDGRVTATEKKGVYDFDPEPDSDTRPSSMTANQEREEDLIPGNLREIAPTTDIEPETEEKISYSSSKQTVAENTTDHEQTVATLQDWLETAGYDCKETEHTDILATRGETVLVIEVKSLSGENDRRQIRKAVGQLTENAYRDVVRRGWGEKELITCLGFSAPPADKFSGYLEFLRDHGIEVLWLEDESVSGHRASQERMEHTT